MLKTLLSGASSLIILCALYLASWGIYAQQKETDDCPVGPCINISGLITPNSVSFGGGFPVYIIGEYQVVSGLPRTNFNLSKCHGPTCVFFGVKVYKNGIRLTPDIQYGRSGYTVFLTIPANPGDTVLFDYGYTFTQ